MEILSLASALVSTERPDPNAFVWLFYLGFVLLVGGCCAYLAGLFSFGGVTRNFAALVAVGLYMFVAGGALVAAVLIWSALDIRVREDNSFLGPSFVGLAVMLVGAALIVFSRLLPASARVPLPDILTPGLFAVLGFVPALALAILLFAFTAVLLSLIEARLPASAQTAVNQLLPIGPVILVGVVTLLLVLLRRGVHAPLNVKLLAVVAAAVVTLALFLRGPSNWSEPPIWGFDILLLALAGSIVVYFVSRNLTAQGATPAIPGIPATPAGAPIPTSAEPASQQAGAAPTPQETPVIWEEPPTGA
jgi:hypothetical protein